MFPESRCKPRFHALVPSTHVECATTACNISSKGSNDFWLSWALAIICRYSIPQAQVCTLSISYHPHHIVLCLNADLCTTFIYGTWETRRVHQIHYRWLWPRQVTELCKRKKILSYKDDRLAVFLHYIIGEESLKWDPTTPIFPWIVCKYQQVLNWMDFISVLAITDWT